MACAILGQAYNEKILPAEKDVIAIMRVLDVFANLVRGCQINIYMRYSVLSWLLKSKSADGRFHKVQSDVDGLAAIMGAGITPCEHLDELAESLIPLKGRVKLQPVISVEILEADFDGYVLSFDGATKTSTVRAVVDVSSGNSPVVTAQGFVLEDVTVNDAEYHSLLKGLIMVAERDILDVVVVGDSRIVIQQVQGLINCNQPNLQRRLAEYGVLREKFKSVRLVHVKREYNQTLALGESWPVTDPTVITLLECLPSIPEKLMKPVVVLDPVLDPDANDDPTRETPPGEPVKIQPGSESAPLPTQA
ncbi:LOW QUALITY PROTEIN: hypothetical protein PHMEG_00033836 [Phytophthora megakarya]|uniref:RNase H type-1 domain-containing protein n=1 Tax=Phytophthora megakarya TaxID=4795 RepID=A0A225USL1_9STRA|nr:LOW QUALITY PROTEIN: hypothetical protein PHMEG_00033836 [Phytophthora megakarya]